MKTTTTDTCRRAQRLIEEMESLHQELLKSYEPDTRLYDKKLSTERRFQIINAKDANQKRIEQAWRALGAEQPRLATARLIEMTSAVWPWVESMADVELVFECVYRLGRRAYDADESNIALRESPFIFGGLGTLVQMQRGMPSPDGGGNLFALLFVRHDGSVELPASLSRFGAATRDEAVKVKESTNEE